MAEHEFTMPISEDDVRKLKTGDHVVLQDTLFGLRDATLIHMFDKGRETRLDLDGHAVIHTAPNLKKVPVSNSFPAGYQSICIGTTTSARMERFTRPLMEKNGVRMIIGKGGRHIAEDAADDHIAGYSILNDGTLTDWADHTSRNVTPGKNFDSCGAFGPWR